MEFGGNPETDLLSVQTNGGAPPVDIQRMRALPGPMGGTPVVTADVSYGGRNQTHSPNEHVRLEDFLKASRHIARIVLGFGEL